MGNPYNKPTMSGFNANPPSDDNTQEPQNQVEWQKHVDKLGTPNKNHTEQDADATETAFGLRFANGTIATSVTYSVSLSDRGKIIQANQSGIDINLPDATDAQVTDGWELAIQANQASGTIDVKPSGNQTINGIGDIQLEPGDFLILSSFGGNWTGLPSLAPTPAPSPILEIATKTDADTVTSETYTAITGLSVNVTPPSASSKVQITGMVSGSSATSASQLAIRLERDGNPIFVGDPAGSRVQATAIIAASIGSAMNVATFSFVDTPNTTSQVTYRIAARKIGSPTCFINRQESDSDASTTPRAASSLVVAINN